MKLSKLFITNDIRCEFHDGLNIILGVNRRETDAYAETTIDAGQAEQGELAEESQVSEQDEPTKEQTNAEEIPPSEEEKVSDTNGVGKTLLVCVVKHILGGDTETALASPYFTKKKFWGMLEVFFGSKSVVVSRPLWRPLGENLYLIHDGSLEEYHARLTEAQIKLEEIANQRDLADLLERVESPIKLLSKEEYQKHIAKLENIDYSKSNITLSSLLDFIIRDEKVGFSDPISRIRRIQWLQYRSAQYLFGLPASTEENCSKLQEEISGLKVELKTMQERLSIRDITGDDKIENLKLNAKARLEKTQEDIMEVRVIPSLEEAREEYQSTRVEFTRVVSDLNKKEHYLRGYKKNRKDLRTRAKVMAELVDVSKFYDDLIQFFPEQIEKNISEFQSFFDGLAVDRERYYVDLITELKADIKLLQAEKKSLEPVLASLARQFKSSSLIRDISTLTATEEKIHNELRELEGFRKLLLLCESKEEKIGELENLRRDALAEGKKQEKNFKARRKGLISLFHKLVSEIYGVADGELAFEYNSNESSSTAGRTEITCSIPSQGSHGRTYAKINIFDFVWLLGEKKDYDFKPGFLIHDGSYSKISLRVKSKMIEAVKSRLAGRQYFITINEGELDVMQEWEQFVCCRLDGSKVEGKFFGEQFD